MKLMESFGWIEKRIKKDGRTKNKWKNEGMNEKQMKQWKNHPRMNNKWKVKLKERKREVRDLLYESHDITD